MDYITVSDARKKLYQLVDTVSEDHEPKFIKGKRNSAVLIGNEDWEDILETLFVAQNKELSDSILKGMKEPYKKCKTKVEW